MNVEQAQRDRLALLAAGVPADAGRKPHELRTDALERLASTVAELAWLGVSNREVRRRVNRALRDTAP